MQSLRKSSQERMRTFSLFVLRHLGLIFITGTTPLMHCAQFVEVMEIEAFELKQILTFFVSLASNFETLLIGYCSAVAYA
ncbi:hypothetical protein CEXT_170291 [Caerostris extrusa]|uniref:Uncharacterized protein n=1 Tax=Caerostris extrusa TaxID=172846 RepID=A0AAV4U5V6_CAEEX|nr:hypothetical protein CEXT_170291 [Caerostris extrusa]